MPPKSQTKGSKRPTQEEKRKSSKHPSQNANPHWWSLVKEIAEFNRAASKFSEDLREHYGSQMTISHFEKAISESIRDRIQHVLDVPEKFLEALKEFNSLRDAKNQKIGELKLARPASKVPSLVIPKDLNEFQKLRSSPVVISLEEKTTYN